MNETGETTVTSVEEPAQRLWQLWQQGRRPDVAQFLAYESKITVSQIAAVLRVDQRQRWESGERVSAESYLQSHPILQEDSECALELIYGEFLLRESMGESPKVEEYLSRFPQYRARLEQQVALHQALGERPLESEDTTVCYPEGSESPLVPGKVPANAKGRNWPVVPGYEIVGELGRGAMGIVYQARQIALNRLVALKVILDNSGEEKDRLVRFRWEARAVARLQHPNIVQIYEVGDQEGRPFFSLEYLNGGSLAQNLAGQPHPPRAAAELVMALARAVHHAHQQGVVHRDLKPANILLTTDGVPKVTDFGLAKLLDKESAQTQSGVILGTPSYMAPEQATGTAGEAGPLMDVYSLGAILYEMLTGKPPFHGHTVMETLHQVRTEEPVPPGRLQPNVPRDLQTICLKCLQKEPGRRFASAEALAQDLSNFLAGQSIQAKSPGAWERCVLWARRRPALAGLMVAIVAAGFGLFIGFFWYNALTVAAVGVISLIAAAWWYNARLQAALREIIQQQGAAERNVERLHLLLEVTQRLMAAKDLNTLLQLISETTTQLANAERATIFLLDHKSGELWSKVAMGDGLGEIRIPVGVGIAGTVAGTGETINIPDAYSDPRFNPDVDRRTGYKTRSLLTFPMKAKNGRILGVFQVLNKRGGPFGPGDVDHLSMLAAAAAVATEKAQDLINQSESKI